MNHVTSTAQNVLVLMAAYGFNSEQEYKLETLREQNEGLVKLITGAKDLIVVAERNTKKNMWLVFEVVDQLATKRSQADMDAMISTVISKLKVI